EDPVRVVDRAAVEHLHHHLYVGGIEEPEVARVVRQGYRVAVARRPVVLRPYGGDLESPVPEAQDRGGRDAAPGRLGERDRGGAEQQQCEGERARERRKPHQDLPCPIIRFRATRPSLLQRPRRAERFEAPRDGWGARTRT